MKIAVDSSILLDVLGADPEFGESSKEALRQAYDSGVLVACDVVWAEVRAHFTDSREFGEALALLGISFDPLTRETAETAGELWRRFCLAHRRPRQKVIADFFIGAHALGQADVLLSRDRGFFTQHFPNLQIVKPV